MTLIKGVTLPLMFPLHSVNPLISFIILVHLSTRRISFFPRTVFQPFLIITRRGILRNRVFLVTINIFYGILF